MPVGYHADFDSAELGTLTAVGVTNAQKTTGANLTFQVKLEDVGSSVVIRLEGSLDGDDYFNLAADNASYTLSANGTYGYVLFAPVQYVRLRLVTITGGTPTVSALVGTI